MGNLTSDFEVKNLHYSNLVQTFILKSLSGYGSAHTRFITTANKSGAGSLDLTFETQGQLDHSTKTGSTRKIGHCLPVDCGSLRHVSVSSVIPVIMKAIMITEQPNTRNSNETDSDNDEMDLCMLIAEIVIELGQRIFSEEIQYMNQKSSFIIFCYK